MPIMSTDACSLLLSAATSHALAFVGQVTHDRSVVVPMAHTRLGIVEWQDGTSTAFLGIVDFRLPCGACGTLCRRLLMEAYSRASIISGISVHFIWWMFVLATREFCLRTRCFAKAKGSCHRSGGCQIHRRVNYLPSLPRLGSHAGVSEMSLPPSWQTHDQSGGKNGAALVFVMSGRPGRACPTFFIYGGFSRPSGTFPPPEQNPALKRPG
jgi:hypothetical protein